MPDTRCRKLTVVLAAGALSMFGAAGAAFAQESPPGGGGGGGGNPLCGNMPTAMLPICADQGEQPGGGGGSAPSATLPAEDSGPGGGGGHNPLCAGTPLSTTPVCAAPGQQPPDGGGGGTSPSAIPVNQSGDEDEKGGGADNTGGDSDGKGGDPITPGDGNNPLCAGAYGVPPPLCPEPGEGNPSPSGSAPTIVPADHSGDHKSGDEQGGGEDNTGGDSDGKGGDPVTPGDGNNPLCAGTLAGTPACPSQPGEGPPDGQGGDGGGPGSGGTSPSA